MFKRYFLSFCVLSTLAVAPTQLWAMECSSSSGQQGTGVPVQGAGVGESEESTAVPEARKCCVCCSDKPVDAFPILACKHQECCAECLIGMINAALERRDLSKLRCTFRKTCKNNHQCNCRHELSNDEIAALPGEKILL